MQTRLYEVSDRVETHDEPRLIEASSAAAAIKIAIGDRFSAKVATPKRVAELMTKEVDVEYIAESKPDAAQKTTAVLLSDARKEAVKS